MYYEILLSEQAFTPDNTNYDYFLFVLCKIIIKIIFFYYVVAAAKPVYELYTLYCCMQTW